MRATTTPVHVRATRGLRGWVAGGKQWTELVPNCLPGDSGASTQHQETAALTIATTISSTPNPTTSPGQRQQDNSYDTFNNHRDYERLEAHFRFPL